MPQRPDDRAPERRRRLIASQRLRRVRRTTHEARTVAMARTTRGTACRWTWRLRFGLLSTELAHPTTESAHRWTASGPASRQAAISRRLHGCHESSRASLPVTSSTDASAGCPRPRAPINKSVTGENRDSVLSAVLSPSCTILLRTHDAPSFSLFHRSTTTQTQHTRITTMTTFGAPTSL